MALQAPCAALKTNLRVSLKARTCGRMQGGHDLCLRFAGWPVLLVLFQYWQAFITFDKGELEAQSYICRTNSSSSVDNYCHRVFRAISTKQLVASERCKATGEKEGSRLWSRAGWCHHTSRACSACKLISSFSWSVCREAPVVLV